MFYSQFILAKKGPLGTIWIAAHLERKLRKNQVADTDIGVSVDSILFPEVPIALRLSSHLLLGVVRIYSRKVGYLFDDCSEALLKIKQAFRSTAVDLPPEQSKAPYHSITLPETFDLDDFELPDSDLFQGNYVDHHVSTKEQITLQDTMDGVTFTTSQFGLDERFGDGDTSQFSLDLDEDLLLDKGAAPGPSGFFKDSHADPQASTPWKGGDSNEEAFEASKATSSNSFGIQAPSTPGLMEEANFPSAQDALISDDHMDEDNNLNESATKEVFGTASSEPHLYNVDNYAVQTPVSENSHHMEEQQLENALSGGIERSAAEPMELMSPNDPLPSSGNEHIGASNDLDIVKNNKNENLFGSEPNTAIGVQEVGLNGTMEEVHDQRDGVPVASHLNGFLSPMFDDKSEHDKSSLNFGVHGGLEGDLKVLDGSKAEDAEDQAYLKAEQCERLSSKADENLSSAMSPALQACNSGLNHDNEEVSNLINASNLSAQGTGLCSQVTSGREDKVDVSTEVQDAREPTLNTDENVYPASVEVNHANQDDLDGHLDDQIPRDSQSEKESNARMPDLPAPEKLLSVPGQSNYFLPESTPEREAVMEGDNDVAVDKMLSGKKRSFTESSITVQSINSVESSGAAQSKKSAEFIPDDDDLLSSILVGRQSTALKVKPTPPVLDTVSKKRRRVSIRPSASKRKVLVDDAMVLHGDVIREQLTNTEDIRRLRKKAPCTRSEIWMLEKQFLDDEFFNEPVFTGMSRELIILHSEQFDLRGIRIVYDKISEAQSQATNEMGPCMRPRPTGEIASEGTAIPTIAGNEGCVEGIGSLVERQGTGPTLSLGNDTLQKEMEAFDHEFANKISEHDISKEKAEIEIGGERVAPVDEANCSGISGAELASAVVPVSEDGGNLTDAALIETDCLNKVDVIDASDKIEAPAQLYDEKVDMEFLEKDATVGGDPSEIRTTGDKEVHDTSNENSKDLKGEHMSGDEILEKMEGIAPDVANADVETISSLPIDDLHVVTATCLEGKVEVKGNDNEVLPLDLRNEDREATSNVVVSEDLRLDPSNPSELDLDMQNVISVERGGMEFQEADPNSFMEADPNGFMEANPDSFMEPREMASYDAITEDQGGFGTEDAMHDTDFLNVDDDDFADEDDDSSVPNGEETRLLDNSGWSARTRAVATYLQTLFHKEAQRGKKEVSLDNLLGGKSRKEASRMFFETLVLKTKDYVQVEQETPFMNINLRPQIKLFKSEF